MSDVAILLCSMCPDEMGAPTGLRPLMFDEPRRLPSGRSGKVPNVHVAGPERRDFRRRVFFAIHVGSASRFYSTYHAAGGTGPAPCSGAAQRPECLKSRSGV